MKDHIYVPREEWLQQTEQLAHAEAEIDQLKELCEHWIKEAMKARRKVNELAADAERWRKHGDNSLRLLNNWIAWRETGQGSVGALNRETRELIDAAREGEK